MILGLRPDIERFLGRPDPAILAALFFGRDIGVVRDLVQREAITALVRELALQAQLVARDEGHWMLRVERESLNQPSSRERLRNALHAAGHQVELSVEVGGVIDSPSRRIAHAAAQRQLAAEQIIMGDAFVQKMMRDFGAKIVPGSIKPAGAASGKPPQKQG